MLGTEGQLSGKEVVPLCLSHTRVQSPSPRVLLFPSIPSPRLPGWPTRWRCCLWPGHAHLSPVLSAAEANAISENTDTLHLSPQVVTEYAGPGAHRRPEVCERSCEELGTMITELSGLHVIVNQLHENLRKVVGAWRPPPAQRRRSPAPPL